MNWFLNNWRTLIPVVSLALGFIGGLIGVNFVVRPGTGDKTQIIIEYPLETNFSIQGGEFEVQRNKINPMFRMRVRADLAQKLAERNGTTFFQEWKNTRKLTNNDYDSAMVAAAKVTGVDIAAIGDGKIIGAILDWLRSPEGKAFLDALLKLLIGLILSEEGA